MILAVDAHMLLCRLMLAWRCRLCISKPMIGWLAPSMLSRTCQQLMQTAKKRVERWKWQQQKLPPAYH